MKKFARIFALALVFVLSVVALTACSPKPNTDIDKAQENLKSNKYTVEVVKKEDMASSLAFAGTALFYGCKAGDIETTLNAFKGSKDSADSLSMIWFTSEELAKSTYESWKKQLDKSKKAVNDMIDELKASLKDLSDDRKAAVEKQIDEAKAELKEMDKTVFGYTDNVFYIGSSDAINSTK